MVFVYREYASLNKCVFSWALKVMMESDCLMWLFLSATSWYLRVIPIKGEFLQFEENL